ncbi:MAG: SDR family oxidoreductase [Candidatus Saccharibacteria bacterium]|nr:SDR family oxidoreductase [Pseudorhodobacter sp.]
MFNLAPVPVPDLTGRTILVTGAGKGIGAELVRILHARGARTYAGVYPVDQTEALPEGVIQLKLDVTSQSDVDAAMARITAEAGRLDVLVNNAGVINPIGALAEIATDDLAPAFAVNVMGVHRMTLAALPLLRAARGTVLNAGTGAATTAMEGWTAYCATKAGMQMLTRMMALELGREGLRIFFLGIPPTDTAMQGKIRASGLNPISQIPQDKLVPTNVPASVMAHLCGPNPSMTEVLLDVRHEVFTSMMDLPA